MADQKRVFTVDEVCRILKTCGEVQVTLLTLGDLRVEFAKPASPGPVGAPLGDQANADTGPPPLPATEIAEIQKIVAETALAQDEADVKERQLSQLFIENPMEAERMLAEGELIEPADQRSDDADDSDEA